MADSVSTLALRVDSQTALNHLNEFGLAASHLGSTTDVLKGKLLQLNAQFLSMNFAKRLIAEAAEGQEVFGKYEQVLGRFTKQADKLVGELRQSFNFDATTAQNSIATMTDLFRKSGIELKDAFAFTSELQKRAADIEAFTNASGGLASVTHALTSGMIGNNLPLRQLGIVINEDAIKAQMAEDALNGLTFATNRAAKMHARYVLIMKQSESAAGQVARESDNYSNKLRKFQAIYADFRNELGDIIIPIATDILTGATKIMQALEGTSATTKKILIGVGAATGAFVAFGPTIMKLTTAVMTLTASSVQNTTVEAANTAASETNATAKNLEATARTRNAQAILAETAALNAQSKSNVASNLTSFSNRSLSKTEKRAAKIAWRAQNEGTRKFSQLPSELVTSPTLKEKLLVKHGSKLASNAGKLGSQTATGTLGKTVGKLGTASNLAPFASKLATPFSKLNGVLGKSFTFITSKLPLLSKFSGILGKALGLFGTGAAVIGMVYGALVAFKNAPQWIEQFSENIYPKIKEFGAKIPDLLWSGIKTAGAAIGKGINWAKNLGIDALVGIGSSIKRLAGFDTAAAQQYRINKLLEDRNKQHEKLLAVQQKQIQQEKEAYAAEEDARRKTLATRAQYAIGRNDDQTKLALAIKNRDKTESDIRTKERDIQALNTSGVRDENGNVLYRGLGELDRTQDAITAQKKQFDSEMERKLMGTSDSIERSKLLSEKAKKDAEFDEQFKTLEDKRQETVDQIKAESDELNALNESWLEQQTAVDDLQKTIEDTNKAIEDDQKAFAKLGDDNRKALEADARQADLENADSHNARLEALRAQASAASEDVEEAQKAKETADKANSEINEINSRLNSEFASKGLAQLSQIAEQGDVENLDQAGRDKIAMEYAGALTMLRNSGYEIDDKYERFQNGDATALLQELQDRRKEEQRRVADLTVERDEASNIYGDLASRQSAQRAAEKAVNDEIATFNKQNDSELWDKMQSDRQRAREQSEFERGVNETYYNRQLQASDRYYGDDAFGAAYSRYQLSGAKASQDWYDSMATLSETQTMIDNVNKALEILNQKYQAGTLTDEEAERRQQLLSQRDSLESEYRSDYESAIQKRLAAEDEAIALENTMRDEYMNQAQKYVDEQTSAIRDQLTEQAQQEEEEQKRRLEERSKVEEEQRQAVAGSRAITSGSSEAFNIASRIYERGQEQLPPEKKIENSTKNIENYVKIMQEQMMNYFAQQAEGLTLAMQY